MSASHARHVRRLSPAEIARIVKSARRRRDMKQSVLAKLAKLNIRTIERLERGTKLADESYRRVAHALDLPADIFIQSNYVPSSSELELLAAAYWRKR